MSPCDLVSSASAISMLIKFFRLPLPLQSRLYESFHLCTHILSSYCSFLKLALAPRHLFLISISELGINWIRDLSPYVFHGQIGKSWMWRYFSLILPFPIAKEHHPPIDTGGNKRPGRENLLCKLPVMIYQKEFVRKLKSEHVDVEPKTSPNFTWKSGKTFIHLSKCTAVETVLLIFQGITAHTFNLSTGET